MKKSSFQTIKLDFSLFVDILKESLKGKTLYRILHNNALKTLTIQGEVLDLGAGSDSSSYLRYLKQKRKVKFLFTDFYRKGKNVIKLDLEKPFKLEQKFDTILCFNVLEHIYNYENVISCSSKQLKKGGSFIASTPFLIRYHPDPQDYFRYTQTSIVKNFEKQGFKKERLIIIGLGPFIVGLEQCIIFIPSFLRVFFIYPALFMDILLLKVFPHYKDKFPLGYVYSFKK